MELGDFTSQWFVYTYEVCTYAKEQKVCYTQERMMKFEIDQKNVKDIHVFVQPDAAREIMFPFVRERDYNMMNVYDVCVCLVVVWPAFH